MLRPLDVHSTGYSLDTGQLLAFKQCARCCFCNIHSKWVSSLELDVDPLRLKTLCANIGGDLPRLSERQRRRRWPQHHQQRVHKVFTNQNFFSYFVRRVSPTLSPTAPSGTPASDSGSGLSTGSLIASIISPIVGVGIVLVGWQI